MDLTATILNPAVWMRERISPCWPAATASGLMIAKVRSKDTKNPPSDLEIFGRRRRGHGLKSVPLRRRAKARHYQTPERSEEHTSELQSQSNIVCRLLLEKQ